MSAVNGYFCYNDVVGGGHNRNFLSRLRMVTAILVYVTYIALISVKNHGTKIVLYFIRLVIEIYKNEGKNVLTMKCSGRL